MFYKILNYFGLIKVDRAKKLSLRLHQHYVKRVVNCIEEDFNRKPADDFLERTTAYWEEAYDDLLSKGHEDVTIMNKPYFKKIK